MLYREKSISVGTVGCEGGGLPNGQDLVPVPDVGFIMSVANSTVRFGYGSYMLICMLIEVPIFRLCETFGLQAGAGVCLDPWVSCK